MPHPDKRGSGDDPEYEMLVNVMHAQIFIRNAEGGAKK